MSSDVAAAGSAAAPDALPPPPPAGDASAESTAVRSLLELPDDAIRLILQATADAAAVLACATAHRSFAVVAANEELWCELCQASWPLLGTARHHTPAHLRIVTSWRQLHRDRVLNAGHGWRDLLPLYDSSVCVATEKRAGWVAELGRLLLRIDRAHVSSPVGDSLGAAVGSPKGVWDSSPWVTALAQQRTEEWRCCAATLEHELVDTWVPGMPLSSSRSLGAVAAFAGSSGGALLEHVATAMGETVDDVRARSVSGVLDAWYGMLEQAAATNAREDRERATEMLLQALAGRSALAAIQGFLSERPSQPPRTAALLLHGIIRYLDDEVRHLQVEGCDLSVTAAQRRTTAVEPVPEAHWWWHLEPPMYISGGCPYTPQG